MPNDDPDKLKGPGGMTLRQIHELVKQSAERDRQAQDLSADILRRDLEYRLGGHR
jgi:ferritin-like protein